MKVCYALYNIASCILINVVIDIDVFVSAGIYNPFQGWNYLYSNLSSLAFCLNSTTAEKHNNKMDIPDYSRDYEMVNISLPFELTARPFPGALPLNTTDLVGMIPFYNFRFGRKWTSKFGWFVLLVVF